MYAIILNAVAVVVGSAVGALARKGIREKYITVLNTDSEIARETIINGLEYSDIPLAELRKEKVSGNPGFDYHSENKNNIIIFGEAKYVAGQNAYGRALKQVVEFIDAKKDLKELTELTYFVSNEAIKNANLERKGYAIGFSSYSTSSEDLISNIRKSKHFKKIIRYEEIIIVAVDING